MSRLSVAIQLVHSSLCELSIKERNIEFKAVLAYESKK
ncbi:Hok/Gef family protein [Klebsiella pneumoniae]|nr:Hok/Gef family protein [Klebsiella pneumoniae]